MKRLLIMLCMITGCAHQKPKSYQVIPISCVTQVEAQPALCAVSGKEFECNKVHVKASCITVKEEQ